MAVEVAAGAIVVLGGARVCVTGEGLRIKQRHTPASRALVMACLSERGLMCLGMPAAFAIRATIQGGDHQERKRLLHSKSDGAGMWLAPGRRNEQVSADSLGEKKRRWSVLSRRECGRTGPWVAGLVGVVESRSRCGRRIPRLAAVGSKFCGSSLTGGQGAGVEVARGGWTVTVSSEAIRVHRMG